MGIPVKKSGKMGEKECKILSLLPIQNFLHYEDNQRHVQKSYAGRNQSA